MLKRQLSIEDRKTVNQLEKDGVLKVFDGSPQEERVRMISLLIDQGCTLKEAVNRVDEELKRNMLCCQV